MMKIYLTEPAVDDAPEWVDEMACSMPAAAVAPAARRVWPPRNWQKLRNWQKFLATVVPCMAADAMFLLWYSGLAVALIGLAIWSATVLVILTLAGRAGRL